MEADDGWTTFSQMHKKTHPKTGGDYLCRIRMNDVEGAYFYEVLTYEFTRYKWLKDHESLSHWHTITHWRPLPNPPKDKK